MQFTKSAFVAIMVSFLCQCNHYLVVDTTPSGATISTSWGSNKARSPAKFTIPNKQAPVTLTAEWPSGAKVTKEILPVYRNNGFGEYECRVLLPRPSLARGSTLDYSVGLEIDRQNLQRDIADQTERIANRAAQNARQATLDEMSSNQMQQQADQIDLMNEKSREENQRNAQKYQELFRYSKPKTYIVTPDVFQVPGSSGRSYRIREQ